MKKFISVIFLIVLPIIFIGCASVSATYSPPENNSQESDYTKIVNKNFDETWEALINFAASTFFGIENFEKESGLLTLSFGASNPQEFITGGYWKTDIRYGMQELHFEGDYVEYLSLYHNGELTGKMNIVVKKISQAQTKLIINARYVFTTNVVDANGINHSNSWSFNSGACKESYISNATRGTQPTRTICPTYKAEKTILDAIN